MSLASRPFLLPSPPLTQNAPPPPAENRMGVLPARSSFLWGLQPPLPSRSRAYFAPTHTLNRSLSARWPTEAWPPPGEFILPDSAVSP